MSGWNLRGSGPVYGQILEEFRRMLLAGMLVPGDRLPSVRELSAELAINPNTIMRAYRELEGQGYIYSQPGRGSFVADVESEAPRRREALYKKLRELLSEMKFWGIGQSEIEKFVRGEVCKND